MSYQSSVVVHVLGTRLCLCLADEAVCVEVAIVGIDRQIFFRCWRRFRAIHDDWKRIRVSRLTFWTKTEKDTFGLFSLCVLRKRFLVCNCQNCQFSYCFNSTFILTLNFIQIDYQITFFANLLLYINTNERYLLKEVILIQMLSSCVYYNDFFHKFQKYISKNWSSTKIWTHLKLFNKTRWQCEIVDLDWEQTFQLKFVGKKSSEI